MPGLSYKYIADRAALKFLLDGRLKFTPVAERNDPTELVPKVFPEKVRKSLDRIRRDGYTAQDIENLRMQGALLKRLSPDNQMVEAPSTSRDADRLIQSFAYDNFDCLVERLSRTAHDFASKVGVFCVSSRPDSLPMWAHYAANAGGAVVEFENLSDCFSGDETGVPSKFENVRYRREPEGITFEPRSHENLFFEKDEDWGYEAEDRVVLALDDCQKSDFRGTTLYTSAVDPRQVRSIIVGWRMERSAVDEVCALVGQHRPDVELKRARIESGRILMQSA